MSSKRRQSTPEPIEPTDPAAAGIALCAGCQTHRPLESFERTPAGPRCAECRGDVDELAETFAEQQAATREADAEIAEASND